MRATGATWYYAVTSDGYVAWVVAKAVASSMGGGEGATEPDNQPSSTCV